jgi:hypothetical protein
MFTLDPFCSILNTRYGTLTAMGERRTVFRSTVQRRASRCKITRKTGCEDDFTTLVSIPPQIMYAELSSVACSIHVHVQYTSIRLLQLPTFVFLVTEKLISMFGYASVYKYTVDAAKLFVTCGETGALRGPGGDVAGVDKDSGGIMFERCWRRLEI